ncbi:GNAT family N-acetyltransferase [Rhodospirillum sp. A1_3_36]|uniref:GNAT family N-acetyltransferase n=1 Tax=Rhodospirillum sp. A1_3_36 TaxID=3391666 RepID=UPI0039A5875E
MKEDVIRVLGLLCLGTRLKRAGERLQADTDEILKAGGVTIAAAQYPFLASLDRLGPSTLGDLAEAVGVSQPGATRTVNRLVELGLLETVSGEGDRRHRVLHLTAEGRRLVRVGKDVLWPRVEAAVADLCAGLGGSLLGQLADLEDRLSVRSLTQRARHPLDRPIWTALTTRHAHLAEGGAHARRYPGDTSPFVATRDEGPDSLAALAALGGAMVFLQVDPVVLPAGMTAIKTAMGVQMVAEGAFPAVEDPEIGPLGPEDAADMAALADLTKPGPFTLKAMDLGGFWGIRKDGRLIAMAGERLKVPGMTELSGLCTHPEEQGKGLGKRLLAYVAGQISARGDRVFLHAYASNRDAIRLYESMGFRERCPVHVAMIEG